MTLLLLKLVFNVIIIHCFLRTALILMFACLDCQRGDTMTSNNDDNNLCVRIKKNVQSEIPLID